MVAALFIIFYLLGVLFLESADFLRVCFFWSCSLLLDFILCLLDLLVLMVSLMAGVVGTSNFWFSLVKAPIFSSRSSQCSFMVCSFFGKIEKYSDVLSYLGFVLL